MSSPIEGSPVNGHVSLQDADSSSGPAEHVRSDSELHDPHHTPADQSSPSPIENHNGDVSDRLHDDRRMSDSDGSSPRDASDDGDFEMQDGVASEHDDDADQTRASSADSSRPSKRKSAPGVEDFIQANPELYGLRRSVCHIKSLIQASGATNIFMTRPELEEYESWYGPELPR